jgi:hypothetical protein
MMCNKYQWCSSVPYSDMPFVNIFTSDVPLCSFACRLPLRYVAMKYHYCTFTTRHVPLLNVRFFTNLYCSLWWLNLLARLKFLEELVENPIACWLELRQCMRIGNPGKFLRNTSLFDSTPRWKIESPPTTHLKSRPVKTVQVRHLWISWREFFWLKSTRSMGK